MRLLFVHDHRFVRGASGAMHTVGSFPRSVWQRYLDCFDELVVVARDGGSLQPDSNLARSDVPGLRFTLIKNYTLTQRLLSLGGEAQEVLARELADADALLVRLPSDLGNLAVKMARSEGLVWAGEAVGCALDGYRNYGNLLSRAYAPLAAERMRRVADRAEQMLYVTRRFLQDRYPCPSETAAVSDVEIVPLTANERAQRKHRLTKLAAGHRPIFGTVASLRTRSKGIQDAITALGRLRQEGLLVKYRVLGAGDRTPWIECASAAGVADTVIFDGSRPSGASVREWLDQIDIHVQPSYQEGLPRATVEAMSRGCACLGSTVGGLPELLPVERLHAPGNIKELSELLNYYAQKPDAVAIASHQDLLTSEAYLPDSLNPIRHAFYDRLAQRARETN